MPFRRSIFCSNFRIARCAMQLTGAKHTQPLQTRTRFAAYPPCTGTIHRFLVRNPLCKITARNSNLPKTQRNEPLQQTLSNAGKLSMQRPRSSQPQPLHHHTSEHSNFWTITARDLHHSLGQTTHCQKPGPIFCSAHAEQKTNTRIQTHQNLFTLTKNISAPQQNQAGSKHPVFRFPTFAGTATKKPKLDFPCTNQPPSQPVIARRRSRRSNPSRRNPKRNLVEMDGIEPTTPCLQSRCSTN